MDSKELKIVIKRNPQSYKIKVGDNLLASCGEWAKETLTDVTNKIAVISNEKVYNLYGETVKQSLTEQGFEVFVWLMKDGEKHKNFSSLQEILAFFSENNLNRSDAVVALGGGVVGDLSAFASSIYLRGVTLLQIPTSLLAMIDSSVGGKTAINSDFGKNLIGSFYQPSGVLVDIKTLKTLEQREVTAGFCEAIKQGAVGSPNLFANIRNFLETYELSEFQDLVETGQFIENLEKLIRLQISFKANVVIQDEQESIKRNDENSRKILNFGHTTAHALEKITNYSYFKHGEAVGYGIMVAGEISNRLAICDKKSINLLNDVVKSIGYLPSTNNIDVEKLFELFAFDKKSIGKSIQWILLEAIGKPKIVENKHIPDKIIKEALLKILH